MSREAENAGEDVSRAEPHGGGPLRVGVAGPGALLLGELPVLQRDVVQGQGEHAGQVDPVAQPVAAAKKVSGRRPHGIAVAMLTRTRCV